MEVRQPVEWYLLAGGSLAAAVAYLVLLAAAAASAQMTGGKEPALLLWIGATVGLIVVLLRLAWRLGAVRGSWYRGAAVVACVAMVVVVLASFGFVVMVNIWGKLGLGI